MRRPPAAPRARAVSNQFRAAGDTAEPLPSLAWGRLRDAGSLRESRRHTQQRSLGVVRRCARADGLPVFALTLYLLQPGAR
jgi:hypothetical protein